MSTRHYYSLGTSIRNSRVTLSVRVGGRLSVVRVWVGGSGDGVDSCVKFRDLT